MRRIFYAFLLHFVLSHSLHAQNAMLWKSARTNVMSVSNNPAVLRLKPGTWSASVFSFTGDIVSNSGSMSSRDLLHLNTNFLRQNVLGNIGISTGMGSIDFKGPSLAYGLSSKLSLAVTTRTRLHSNYWNADGRLISEIGEIVKVPQEYPYFMKREQMQMLASTFSEIGFSASYITYETDVNSLTIGLSLNIINGTANTSISVPTLTGSIRRINSYLTSLTEASGQVSTKTSGQLFSNLSLKNLIRPQKASVSSTIGMIYEYSPTKKEGYKLRLGLSLTDIGYLRFRPDSAYSKSYDINIPGNKGLFFNNNFNNSAFSQTTKVFDKYPEFFDRTNQQTASYSVVLPGALEAFADLRLTSNIFIGSHGRLSLTRKNDVHTLRTNSSVIVSPRWEGRNWGLAVSLGHQELGGFSSGISVKAGPVFISSSTLISSTFDRSKQLSLSAGLTLPSSFLK